MWHGIHDNFADGHFNHFLALLAQSKYDLLLLKGRNQINLL